MRENQKKKQTTTTTKKGKNNTATVQTKQQGIQVLLSRNVFLPRAVHYEQREFSDTPNVIEIVGMRRRSSWICLRVLSPQIPCGRRSCNISFTNLDYS